MGVTVLPILLATAVGWLLSRTCVCRELQSWIQTNDGHGCGGDNGNNVFVKVDEDGYHHYIARGIRSCSVSIGFLSRKQGGIGSK